MSTAFPKIVNRWLKNIQFYLLPPTCVQCRQPAFRRDLCADCEAALPRIRNPCRRCALPLPRGYGGEDLCGTCMVLPPPWTRLMAPFSYKPPLSALVAAYKYQGRLVTGRELTACLLDSLQAGYDGEPLPDLLVPAPLHWRRLQQRGFNQALEMARWLSRSSGIPLDPKALVRTRHTQQQTGLSAAERKRNLRGAFRLRPGFAIEPGRTVAIVDDVVTTGTTVSAMARVLLRAGAAEVHVWAIARTCL